MLFQKSQNYLKKHETTPHFTEEAAKKLIRLLWLLQCYSKNHTKLPLKSTKKLQKNLSAEMHYSTRGADISSRCAQTLAAEVRRL